MSNSVINFNGVAKTTTFASVSRLTATIQASDVATAGIYLVTVTNPTPGGGTSNSQTFTVLEAASKFVILDPGSGMVGVQFTITIQAQDSSNQLVTTYNGGVTLVATGTSVTGGGLANIVNGVGTSTVSTNVAQTVTLALSDTQSTGFDVSSSRLVTFSPGPTAAFTLTHPGSISTGARAAYVVGRKDQFNNLTSGSSTIVYLYSSSTSTTKTFFDAAAGGNQISSTTIPTGSTSTKFWYYDTVPGTFTVTASDNPATPDGAAGIVDATDNLTIAAGAVKFVFANVPATAAAGDTVTFNVEAVDSFGTIDTSFNQDVTVTKTGSASGGGLVDIVNGITATTITDVAAENVTLGLQDTQSTGLGVTDVKTIAFIAAPAPPTAPAPAPGPAAPSGVPTRPNPGINITFSGWAYPGASISLIRKDLGLAQAPVLQTESAASDGSFSVKLNNVIRLTGQTYILVFADRNGVVSETKAYNISAGKEDFVDDNMVIAPTVGFGGGSVVNKRDSIVIQGYAALKSTVTILVDGNNIGTVTVNNSSGQYRYVLNAADLVIGRHSIAAFQVYNKIQSDSSSQQSFAVSPLANPKLDLNGDGVVDIKDISIYFSYLKNLGAGINGFNTIDKNLLRVLDLSGDGKLDVQDLSILLRAARLR